MQYCNEPSSNIDSKRLFFTRNIYRLLLSKFPFGPENQSQISKESESIFNSIPFSVVTVISPAAKCGKSEDDPVGLISVTAAVLILCTLDAGGGSDPITNVEDGHTDSISANLS